MWTVDDIIEMDETLSIQLRLALASPLWKSLPYGAQLNPRAWRIEVLAVRPGRRLCAWITVPWKGAADSRAALCFGVMIWRNHKARSLHRMLVKCNGRQEASGGSERRMLCYDALSHAMILQYRPGRTAGSAAVDPENNAGLMRVWVRRVTRLLCRALRG